MAAPNYTEDLTDITLAESTTGWSALGGGASGLGVGVDFAMEGTNCVDKQITAAEKGQVYNNGSTITPGTNTHFFVWVFLATPGLANTLANRGLAVVLGTATTAYVQFHVEGSNTYGATGRVGKCYAIRYNNTTSASPPYRTLTGSPGANPQYFGATANITGSVKSSNLGVDAIRHGTGAYITAGESGDPATFEGFAAQNDNLSNRWGILTAIGGGYELQGRFVVGQDNTQSPTACYFNDSNAVVSFIDTPHSLTDFTQIIVDHASTVFNLTNVTLQALGTNNPGRLVFNNSSTTSALTGCTFSGMGITTLQPGVTSSSCIWRGCGQITGGGSTFDECTISNSTAAVSLVLTNLNQATDCEFVSDGTNHAINLGTVSGTTSMNWNNYLTGYAASDGSTGNEAILVNVAASQTLTINVGAGYSTPSVYNTGSGTVSVVSGQATTTITINDLSTGLPIQGANVLVWVTGSPTPSNYFYQVSVSITGSGTTATVTQSGHGLTTGDHVIIEGVTNDDDYNGVFSINVTNSNTYTYTTTETLDVSPATGSPTATFAVISDTTDSNGQVSDIRSWGGGDQTVSGWARKSSDSPYYQQGAISGTIDSASGANLVIQLAPDE